MPELPSRCEIYTEERVGGFRNTMEKLALTPDEKLARTAAMGEHLATLCFITMEFDCKRVLEFGVFNGMSTVAFLTGLAHTGGKLVSVDMHNCPDAERRVAEMGMLDSWTFVQEYDYNFIPDGLMDIVLIDTIHAKVHTVLMLEKFAGIVAPGGFLMVHDTAEYPGVQDAINEYIAANDGWTMHRWFNDCGLTVLRRHE